MASSRDAPHISAEGCRPAQQAGRPDWPKMVQRRSASRWSQATPAGFPSEVMEGGMQHALQFGRQCTFLAWLWAPEFNS
jgi:hypothetical protein